MRFMFTRRWVLFAVAVVALAYACFRLGEWQFHRLDERVDRNAVVRHNLRADPVPVDRVLEQGAPVPEREEWRQVRATGTYAEDQTVVIRYQTRDGRPGVDVVTPLVTASGTAVLVDRGWLETDTAGVTRPDVPAPPDGEVTVVGWVRANAGSDVAQVTDGSARAISSAEIGPTLPFPVYGGFVDLESQTPEADKPLTPPEPPDLSEGPHFFYGLQWWFFAGLAVFGFGYLAWDERRKARGDKPADEEAPEPANTR